MILGQYNLVLFGIKWYLIYKRLLCLYKLKKINGDVDRPTDRPTNRVNIEQSAFFESWKIEKKQRFAIQNQNEKMLMNQAYLLLHKILCLERPLVGSLAFFFSVLNRGRPVEKNDHIKQIWQDVPIL